MSERVAELLREVLSLGLPERIAFADRLGESIANEPLADDDLTDEEREEDDHQLLLERLAEVDRHPERLIDGEQAMREIEEYAKTKKRP